MSTKSIERAMEVRYWVERGAGMAEYVLLLALIAAAMVASFTDLVSEMQTQVANIATHIKSN